MFEDVSSFGVFWVKCAKIGFEFTWEHFGNLDLICTLIGALLITFFKKKHQSWWENCGERLAKIFIIWILIGELFIGCVLVAPYFQYTEARATPEIKNDPLYVQVLNDLNSAKVQVKDAGKRLDEQQTLANDYKQRWISSLTATNVSVTPQVLQEAIEIVTREQSMHTNPVSLDEVLQEKRDLNALQDKQDMEIKIKYLTPAYDVWQYAFDVFQKNLEKYLTNQATMFDLKQLPSLNFLINTPEPRNTFIPVQPVVRTNWDWVSPVESKPATKGRNEPATDFA